MDPVPHLSRSVKGKVALVTGAASGMGRATATVFAREGASVLLVDRNGESAKETQALIEREGGADRVRVFEGESDFAALREMVVNCARGAALATRTGLRVEYGTLERGMKLNDAVTALAAENAKTSSRDVIACGHEGIFARAKTLSPAKTPRRPRYATSPAVIHTARDASAAISSFMPLHKARRTSRSSATAKGMSSAIEESGRSRSARATSTTTIGTR